MRRLGVLVLGFVTALMMAIPTPAAGIEPEPGKATGGVTIEGLDLRAGFFTEQFSFTAQGVPGDAKGKLNYRGVWEALTWDFRLKADIHCYYQDGNRAYISGVYTKAKGNGPYEVGEIMSGVVVDNGEPGIGPEGDQVVIGSSSSGDPSYECADPLTQEVYDAALAYYWPGNESASATVVAGNIQVHPQD